MNKVIYTALCVASVLALPGCWSCSKEEQKEAPVTTEAVKPAEGTEAAKPAEVPAPEAAKPAEEVPAKM